jgi:ABC-type nickel/cobalt efflux system permease component RcnA
VLVVLISLVPAARSHDIPNQRVDRSIQVTLRPGLLQVDYEVSLTELTLTQDLRSLIGSLPGADRTEWLDKYGTVTGPLNAKGLLVRCDGRAVDLSFRSFDLHVEEHPRYLFHLEASLPKKGRLVVQDTNYASSEGTSRLAVRPRGDVRVEGDDLPADVEAVPIRPVWQLSDEEERRTKRVEVRFKSLASPVAPGSARHSEAVAPKADLPPSPAPSPPSIAASGQLSQLLDRGAAGSTPLLMLIAAGLGAIHAVQPGHGKTMVSAVALGPGGRWYHPAVLAVLTTLTHTGSVLLIALFLWLTGATRVAGLHRGLTRSAGFAIAAGGFWRLGRFLGGWGEHSGEDGHLAAGPSLGGIIGLGIAGGLVPCWDAVGLVVLSAALGRLETGVVLVVAFGLGMAAVLVGVGLAARRLKATVIPGVRAATWESHLGLASGTMLAAIGLVFFLS